ncbi:MAG TPA: HAD family hydrolase, partial [Sphingomicrobium sp.]
RNYDMDTLEALCGNVAVLEQLCTVAQGSVVGYSKDGEPIRGVAGIKAQQSDVRSRVQEGCLRYARDDNAAVHRAPVSDTADSRRRAAAAVMARLMFLPMPAELAVLDQFQHDVNLGCGETVPLFDAAAAERDLRRHGLLYMKDAARMYLPAELRSQGLSLSLSFLAQRRFGLDLRMADFQVGALELPIIVADGREVTTSTVEASRTHDGFMTAAIPIGLSQYAIGVQFGRLYEWVEIESAEFKTVKALSGKGGAADLRSTPATPSFESMVAASDRLVRCLDETAFMMIPPPPPTQEPMVLTVVFRPIGLRQAATAPGTSNQMQPVTEGASS